MNVTGVQTCALQIFTLETIVNNNQDSLYLKINGSTSLTGTLLPSTNATINLGSTSIKFANIYSAKFFGDLTGNAETAR